MGFLFAKAHEDDVCGQAMEPGREGRLAAEGVDFAEELEEGFLSEVLGFKGIADHAEAEAVDAARVLAIESFEGGCVALLGAEDGGVELSDCRLERARGRIGKSFHLVSLGAGRISIRYQYRVAAGVKACHCGVTTMQKRVNVLLDEIRRFRRGGGERDEMSVG